MNMKKIGSFKRRSVEVAGASMVETEPLTPSGLPLLVRPALEGVNVADWAAQNREIVEGHLIEHGGLLFRGFDVGGPEGLQRFVDAVSGGSLEYRERSSPRSAVSGNVYTSTDYPAEYPIFLHNENSYQKVWPRKIFFLCETAAESGGETPIADCRRVATHIDADVRRRFDETGWMYVRNFGDGFGLDWPTVFRTTDRSAVEEHCRRNDIEVEWKDGGRLRTRAVRPVTARHPVSGEELWFNHATFFHVSTLEPEVREPLLDEFTEEDLPANTYYGDGTPIEAEVMEHLRRAYERETVRFPWQEGDLLMLDNMLVAHGRAPFRGERRVLAAMADPVGRDEA